jgi:hypothetical protein
MNPEKRWAAYVRRSGFVTAAGVNNLSIWLSIFYLGSVNLKGDDMALQPTADGFDTEVTDVKRVHIERLSQTTILVHFYEENGSLTTLNIASAAPVLIKEQKQT